LTIGSSIEIILMVWEWYVATWAGSSKGATTSTPWSNCITLIPILLQPLRVCRDRMVAIGCYSFPYTWDVRYICFQPLVINSPEILSWNNLLLGALNNGLVRLQDASKG